MSTILEQRILVREFNEDRDTEVVEKLERNCEIRSRKGISIFTNMMGDPLCRIRLYPAHVMMVAEMIGSGELVGVIRGCIKCVGTGCGETHVKMGCILGLRVSPKHRRMGIGLKLVQLIEDWSKKNGAQYIFLATEENNVASRNLFAVKCDYVKLSSLVILVQSITSCVKDQSRDIKIEKLPVGQAISLYKNRFGGKTFFPVDIDVILKEKLNLGTWVSFFKEEDWVGLHNEEINEESISRTPSSWAILSIWNTCEAYKLQLRRAHPFKCFHATLSHAGAKVFPCLKMSTCEMVHKPFGFLFLYGLHGEGERVGELMKSLWCFASRLAGNVKDCKVIITELEASNPLREHIQQGSSMSCINDLWCIKKINGPANDQDEYTWTQPIGHEFLDPRDI